MTTKKKIIIGVVGIVALLAIAFITVSNLMSMPDLESSGISFKTELMTVPDDLEWIETDAAFEMVNPITSTVVYADAKNPMGDNPITTEEWETFKPSLPWVKNIDRNILFDYASLIGSPSVFESGYNPDASAEENLKILDIKGYSWLELAIVKAVDVIPKDTESEGKNPVPGSLFLRTILKPQINIWTEEIYQLTDGEGNYFVMHATETGTPSLNAQLPEGWSLNLIKITEPLIITPTVDGYYNLIIDNLGQGYHQYIYADDIFPSDTFPWKDTSQADGFPEEFSLEDSELEVHTTPSGVEYVRTPDEYFENLPDWNYEAKYVEIDGLRQAYYEAGPADGEVVLLIHGEPTWSYLYRKMIPPLADAGYRVIAMDHVGFGRSDKPINFEYHSYKNHVQRMENFIYELELEGITAFVQDWGSIIGLNVIGSNTELFDRVVMGNGTLPELEGWIPHDVPEKLNRIIANKVYKHHTGPEQQIPERDENGKLLVENSTDGFGYWIAYALSDERLRVSDIAENGTYFPLSDDEERAYGAPYPAPISMAGVRTLPSFINDVPETTKTAWEGLRSFDKPYLTIIGNNDATNLGSVENQNMFIENVPGAKGQPHTRLKKAGHFLQDDQGPEIARLMLEFMAANPVDNLRYENE